MSITPNNLEAEQAVLGSLLLDNATYYDLPSGFTAGEFYRGEHREVFNAIAGLIEAGKAADSLTVWEVLRESEAKASPSYVAGLPDVVPSTARLSDYAAIVMDLAHRRRLIHAYGEAFEKSQDLTTPTKEVQVAVEKLLTGIDDKRVNFTTARESAKRLIRDLDKRFDAGGAARGITTGIEHVDREVWIHPTDFVVVGGRPGDGKSILLWQIARHNAQTMPVMVVSIEMDEQELAQRAVMDYGDLNIGQVRLPKEAAAQDALFKAADRYSKLDITFVPARDAQIILREARRKKRKSGLGLLVIDYVQLVSLPREWGDNRDQRIGELTGRLKEFAAEERVPVVAAAQLRRIQHLERGRDPRPSLEDLRESGNIEQDANAVLLLYRPGVVEGTHEEKKGDWRTTWLLVGKQRMGDAGVQLPLVAQFEYGRFRKPVQEDNEREAA